MTAEERAAALELALRRLLATGEAFATEMGAYSGWWVKDPPAWEAWEAWRWAGAQAERLLKGQGTAR